jgi:hypothetical protein
LRDPRTRVILEMEPSAECGLSGLRKKVDADGEIWKSLVRSGSIRIKINDDVGNYGFQLVSTVSMSSLISTTDGTGAWNSL